MHMHLKLNKRSIKVQLPPSLESNTLAIILHLGCACLQQTQTIFSYVLAHPCIPLLPSGIQCLCSVCKDVYLGQEGPRSQKNPKELSTVIDTRNEKYNFLLQILERAKLRVFKQDGRKQYVIPGCVQYRRENSSLKTWSYRSYSLRACLMSLLQRTQSIREQASNADVGSPTEPASLQTIISTIRSYMLTCPPKYSNT